MDAPIGVRFAPCIEQKNSPCVKILKKSDGDFRRLADAGFTMVYVGIESGDDQALKDCNKGVTQDEFELAAQKCHQAGIA
jgi:radical SAM superfamily enzyme YgiQ (UPF0313 family)